MARLRSFRPAFIVSLFAYSAFSSATESAWNGHTTPGSTTPNRFTVYYVPNGATSYDSSSHLIHYSGKWSEVHSTAYHDNSSYKTNTKNASATFYFEGVGIEWYGSKGKRFGEAQVYIDGKPYERVSAYSSKELSQQLIFFDYALAPGEHTFKIVNTGSGTGNTLDLDALVVTTGVPQSEEPEPNNVRPVSNAVTLLETESSGQAWTLVQNGSTGVSAMQLAIISPTHAIIIDKVEHNPLTVDGHPAWGALFNLETHSVKPLHMQSNSFCAGGTFLSNGTLINVGGNPVVDNNTAAADFGDLDGLQAIRLFHPCLTDSVASCDIYENHARIRMASPRWYNTVLRITDGSAMIIGGSKKGGWINNATVNNPTIEFWPPKNLHGQNGLPINISFLADTLNSNLFPLAFSLPDGKIFMAANTDAMIYDWQTNSERRLPTIPGGVRVTYPMTGTGLLLPLSPDNNYEPEVLLCGGSTVSDTKPGYEISSQDPASAQCARMVLTDEGISTGWSTEKMPDPRIMPDAVLLPTGQVVIVNGGATGISGYSNVIDQVGESNADNPVLTPTLYNPQALKGQRFTSQGMPASQIPRLYHSVASLTPKGDIMIAGSNPNLDRSEVRYGTEYRVEWLSPPYMVKERPIISGLPDSINFGDSFSFSIKLPSDLSSQPNISVALMDLGYVTHAVHANSRLVYLDSSLSSDGEQVSATGPPTAGIYPPGPGFIYALVDGVPSTGSYVMIGDGSGPEVDEGALANLLAQTEVDQYDKEKDGDESTE